MITRKDQEFMQQALYLAEKGRGRVSPNPLVGAVLVRGGKIIGKAAHIVYGGPHAEVALFTDLKKRRLRTNNATLYVTLEPCCHLNKKTPPCLPLIIKSGIRRVVIGHRDLNPKVSGKSTVALRRAGVFVDEWCCAADVHRQNKGYFHWIVTGLPFVTMKVAMSLDGKIATRIGVSKWITSEKSRALVRHMRDYSDAIMVGRGTVCADTPRLTGDATEPLRVIIDSRLRSPLSSTVFRDSNALVITTKKASRIRFSLFEKKKIEVQTVTFPLRLRNALKVLGARGITSVFVEGGAQIFGSCIDEDIIDELIWFIAPLLIGGENAASATKGLGKSSLKKAVRLGSLSMHRIGDDMCITALVQKGSLRCSPFCKYGLTPPSQLGSSAQ